jgi:hypothetical protein
MYLIAFILVFVRINWVIVEVDRIVSMISEVLGSVYEGGCVSIRDVDDSVGGGRMDISAK